MKHAQNKISFNQLYHQQLNRNTQIKNKNRWILEQKRKFQNK